MNAGLNPRFRKLIHGVVLFQMFCIGPFATAYSMTDLPAENQVIQSLIERSKSIAGQSASYSYGKRAVVQELNQSGDVVKQSEKVYKVLLISGIPFQKLIKVEGRDLSATELEREDERERNFRRKLTAVDLERKQKLKEPWITRELVDKFSFVVEQRIVLSGRRTLILSFSGNPEKAGKTIQDKVMSRLTGKLFVDEEESEIVQVSVRIGEPITLGWFGMLGSVTECDCTLVRSRLPGGGWVNVEQNMLVIGRKLFTSMRIKSKEESFDFRPEP